MPLIAKPTGINDSKLRTVETFTSKIEIVLSGCWEWRGYRTKLGYGQFTVAGRSCRAHRVMWELVGREVDYKLQLDHLCRNTCCVNPDHLEQVTGRVNTMRGDTVTSKNAKKQVCRRGHPLSGSNLSIKMRNRNGNVKERVCKRCNTLAVMRTYYKKKADTLKENKQ